MSSKATVLSCADDVNARTGKTRTQTVSYDEIVKLVFEHDRVISW